LIVYLSYFWVVLSSYPVVGFITTESSGNDGFVAKLG
jgi:hypothetical protein